MLALLYAAPCCGGRDSSLLISSLRRREQQNRFYTALVACARILKDKKIQKNSQQPVASRRGPRLAPSHSQRPAVTLVLCLESLAQRPQPV